MRYVSYRCIFINSHLFIGNGSHTTVSFVDQYNIRPDQGFIYLPSESDLTDIDVPLAPLSSTLFPGISSDVEVHTGFQDEHALTADVILAEVKSLMSSVGTSNIVAVRIVHRRTLQIYGLTRAHRLATLLAGH